MRFIMSTIATAVAMSLAGVGTAQTILFDNFGPGDTYLTGIGWSIGYDEDWQQGPGFAVSSESDYLLTSITAAITFAEGTNNEVTLTVYDNDGGTPGSALETSFGTNFHPFGTDEPPPVFAFSGETVLKAGEIYWVVASAADGPGGDGLAWMDNNINDIGLHAQRQGPDGAWSTFNDFRSAMRVEGTLIPAPGALALLAIAGIARPRRRR